MFIHDDLGVKLSVRYETNVVFTFHVLDFSVRTGLKERLVVLVQESLFSITFFIGFKFTALWTLSNPRLDVHDFVLR